MAITMTEIPTTQLIGLAQVQLDRTGTTPASAVQRSCIFGQKTSAGSATALALVQVSSNERAVALFGVGSQLAIMCATYLRNDPAAVLYAVPFSDNGTTKAAGTFTVTGPATGNGTVSIEIGGYGLSVGVTSGDAQNTIAAAINAAINLVTDLPVTSGVSTNVVTVTAKNAGTNGNTIRISVNPSTGQVLPVGVAVALVQPTGGATDPAYATTQVTALAAIAAEDFRHIVWPWTDDDSLDVLDAELISRWGAARGKLSHAYSFLADTVGNATTWGGFRNSPHHTTLATLTPRNPHWEMAASAAGAMAQSLKAHPAVPLTGLVLRDRLGRAMRGPIAGRYTDTENNTVGLVGVGSISVDQYDQVRINAAVTHYKTDGNGSSDTTLRWTNAPHQIAYLISDLRATIQSRASNKVLVDDASVVSPGTPAIDVSMIRSMLIGRYAAHVRDAIVENIAGFKEFLIVERNANDANRVDVLYPPDLANQLNVLAVLFRPYLQLPSEG